MIADSDLHVAPDWLARVVAALGVPGTGPGLHAVRRAAGHRALSRRLAAMQITHGFLPGVLLGRALGRQDCLGATMAFRRETLERSAAFRRSSTTSPTTPCSAGGASPRPVGRPRDTVPATTVPEATLPRCFATNCAGPAPCAPSPRPVSRSRSCNIRWSGRCWPCCFPAGRCGRWGCSPRLGRARRHLPRIDRALGLAEPSGAGLASAAARPYVDSRDPRQLCQRSGGLAGRGAARRPSATPRRLSGATSGSGTGRHRAAMMKTLFLHPPSFDGFDGGAGSRYQARREIRSLLVSDLARPAGRAGAGQQADRRAARRHRPGRRHPAGARARAVRDPHLLALVRRRRAGRRGAEGRQPGAEDRLRRRQGRGAARGEPAPGPPIDFVARNEFDFTIKEIAEGRDWAAIDGLSFRDSDGGIVHNQDRAILEDMDQLPFVTEVYKRDLRIEDYFIGYLLHPYVSLYTGRGCKSRCTFCLWPQTVGGHATACARPACREEIALAKRYFPQVREFFFDDDTFTDNLPRAEAIAQELGKLGVTWSCNAKANVPRDTLKVLKDNGLRLLLVGYESGNQQILYNIKKGMRIEVAQAVYPRLPRTRHHHPRHLYPWPSRGDPRDDRGDHPLRHRYQSGVLDEAEHAANPVLQSLLAEGFKVGGTVAPFPKPLWNDGDSAESQKAGMRKAAGSASHQRVASRLRDGAAIAQAATSKPTPMRSFASPTCSSSFTPISTHLTSIASNVSSITSRWRKTNGVARALDAQGRVIGQTPFQFGARLTTDASFELPVELRNEIARLVVGDEPAAGATWLIDERWRRRRVAIVSGASADIAQPLLSPNYYVRRALAPYADIREARGEVRTIPSSRCSARSPRRWCSPT